MLLCAVLAYSVFLCTRGLSQDSLWVDEAESSINALTILQHGVPTSEYLGLPIFENAYTHPWPESAEYEFRDSSYSQRGLAVYHGWLPLYSIAGSFALAGVYPDEIDAGLKVHHSLQEVRQRILSARMPAVLFGMVFLVGIFFAARELYGIDAGWAVLAAAAVNKTTITFARQARYYTATLALSVLASLMLCHMLKRGRYRDFIFGALCFVGLFHTHLIAFVSLCLVAVLAAPFLCRHPGAAPKLAVFSGILALGTVPWLLLTGFFSAIPDLPKARSLLSWEEIFRYPAERLLFVFLAALTLGLLLAIWFWGKQISDGLKRPFLGRRWAFLILAAWAILAFAIFIWMSPAASYFHSRITLVVMVPALLFGALMCAAFARLIAPRHSVPFAVFLILLIPWAGGRQIGWWQWQGNQNQRLEELIDTLRSLEINPGTRLYADGGNSLILRFCTGLAIQSVMPVRKSFLDSYPGEIMILEGPRYEWLEPIEIRNALMDRGMLSEAAAVNERISRDLYEYQIRTGLSRRVNEVQPPPKTVPDYFGELIPQMLRKTEGKVALQLEDSGNPIFKGYATPDHNSLWQIFFYRFVNPEFRIGAHLNYAERARHGHAHIWPGGWVLIYCPPL